jgi:beta-lactamase superfamily II metal-dependent hydrolase
MKISFINVGYGDSILIEDNEYNKTILIDGGKPEEEHFREFPQRIKAVDYLIEAGIYKIDLMIISHLHEDHVGGLLEVIKHFEVHEVWCNYILPENNEDIKIQLFPGLSDGAARLANAINIYHDICHILDSRGKRPKAVSSTLHTFIVSQNLTIEILAPEVDAFLKQIELMNEIYSAVDSLYLESKLVELDNFINNTSIVALFNYRGQKALLPGDTYNTSWGHILKKGISIKSDILKLPHHGHIDSISLNLINEIDPKFVVISTSNNRPDNCPSSEVVKMFEQYKAANKKEISIIFTDAVNMPPYSYPESRHKAIALSLFKGKKITYKFI